MPDKFWLDEANIHFVPVEKRKWWNKNESVLTLPPGKYIIGSPEAILPAKRLKTFRTALKRANKKDIRYYYDKVSDLYVFNKVHSTVLALSDTSSSADKIIPLTEEALVLSAQANINTGKLTDVMRLVFSAETDVIFNVNPRKPADYYMGFWCKGDPCMYTILQPNL